MYGNIRERVQALREQLGWSQEQLAVHARISARQLQRIERGKSIPHLQTLADLAGALGVEIANLLVGFSNQQMAAAAEEFLCPHCAAPLAQRVPVEHEYGDDDIDVFECGATQGMRNRPCPKDPRFPSFPRDYELTFIEQPKEGTWTCHAIGKTEGAREVYLDVGRGRSQDAARRWLERSYVQAKEGYKAAEDFFPLMTAIF